MSNDLRNKCYLQDGIVYFQPYEGDPIQIGAIADITITDNMIDGQYLVEADRFDCEAQIINAYNELYPDGKPQPAPSLEEVQSSALTQVVSLYKQALTKGFSSSASGSSLNYDYSEDSQALFTKLIMGYTAGFLPYPYPINDAKGVTFKYSQDQVLQLLKDLTAFESNLQAKKMSYESQIRACTTVGQVNTIAISY